MAANLPYFPPPPRYTPKAHQQPTTKIFSFTKTSKTLQSPFGQRPTLFANPEAFKDVDLPRLRRKTTWRLLPNCHLWALVDNWWLWELISWSFAALCMIATIVVLGVYNGRPLPDWPLGLTINAYVSVLGAFAKAGLLLPTAEALGQLKFNWFAHEGGRDITDFQIFDQASRGPWGSLLLMVRTKGRALAALGASVMVLSTVLDPFFQEVVNYPAPYVPNGNSTIMRSRLFTAGQFDGVEFDKTGRTYSLDRSIYYFVQSMLYYNNTPGAPEIPLVCPTGECTWDPFETLSVCSSCADISHMLTYGCLDAQEDWRLNFDNNGSLWRYPKASSCGYYLNASSNDPMLMTGYGTSLSNNETLITRLLPLDYPTNGVMSYYNTSIMFRDIPNPIVNVVYASTPGGFAGVHANATPIAKECNLRWCIQKTQSSVRGGVLDEVVIESYGNTSKPQYPWKVNWTTPEYFYNQTPRIKSKMEGLSFGLESNGSAFDVAACFWESTQSYITAESQDSEPWWRYSALHPTTIVPASVTPWAYPHNITEHFAKVARTFSSVLRSRSNGTDTIQGVAYSPVTHIEIRWQWLSLPLALLLFSLVFLLASILQTRSGGVEVWKTSALAVLLHGIKEDDVGGIGERSSHTGLRPMQKRTDSGPTLLRFKGRNGRWRFSRRL